MIRRTTALRAACCILAALPLALQIAAEARQAPRLRPQPRSRPTLFETSVRPVLAANCYDCHGDERMGGLRLDSREGLLKGGKSGPAIVPGDPEKSLLIQAVRQTHGAEDAEGRSPEAGRDRRADGMGEGRRDLALLRAAARRPPEPRRALRRVSPRPRRRPRRRTSSRRSSARSGRSSRFTSRRCRRCRMRRGRRPTSTATCSRVSSAPGWRQYARPTSAR